MQRRFAIGDVHGCAKTLEKLLNEIGISASDEVFFVGDYVDRGPGSKEVVDLLMALTEKGYKLGLVKGNHEHLMINSTRGRNEMELWMKNGGGATLSSFGVSSYNELDEKYFRFFQGLSYYFQTDDFYIVHAGFDFRKKDFLSDTDAMMWIRYYEADAKKLGGRRIIHGHTPLYLGEIKSLITSNDPAIDIDNGCCYKHMSGFGSLCCLNLDTMELCAVGNVE